MRPVQEPSILGLKLFKLSPWDRKIVDWIIGLKLAGWALNFIFLGS